AAPAAARPPDPPPRSSPLPPLSGAEGDHVPQRQPPAHSDRAEESVSAVRVATPAQSCGGVWVTIVRVGPLGNAQGIGGIAGVQTSVCYGRDRAVRSPRKQ